ncbi:MAG: hypothetical protein K0S98_561 [Propionibacteriaceae bacterium]|nr:hypothetical protein [Propionibacteriaceae bacterium]
MPTSTRLGKRRCRPVCRDSPPHTGGLGIPDLTGLFLRLWPQTLHGRERTEEHAMNEQSPLQQWLFEGVWRRVATKARRIEQCLEISTAGLFSLVRRHTLTRRRLVGWG